MILHAQVAYLKIPMGITPLQGLVINSKNAGQVSQWMQREDTPWALFESPNHIDGYNELTPDVASSQVDPPHSSGLHTAPVWV